MTEKTYSSLEKECEKIIDIDLRDSLIKLIKSTKNYNPPQNISNISELECEQLLDLYRDVRDVYEYQFRHQLNFGELSSQETRPVLTEIISLSAQKLQWIPKNIPTLPENASSEIIDVYKSHEMVNKWYQELQKPLTYHKFEELIEKS